MSRDVRLAITQSAADFRGVVWPRISRWCGGGEIVPVESVSESGFARSLDVLSGIDAWQVIDELGMRGIASRVQYGFAWPSFTVRLRRNGGGETEMHKRRRAVRERDRGWLYPAVTVQAYLDRPDGALLYACVTATADLMRVADDDMRGVGWEERVNQEDGNAFAVFWVATLRRLGVRVREWSAETPLLPEQVYGEL